MTKEDLAARLTGCTYPFDLSKEIAQEARSAGLVVVFGASDDLLELRGALDDEVSASNGVTVWLMNDGLFDTNACASYCWYFEGAFQHVREYGRSLTALWDPGDGYSWRYETDIPHATFEIVEEGEPYCRGIVFALSDVERTG